MKRYDLNTIIHQPPTPVFEQINSKLSIQMSILLINVEPHVDTNIFVSPRKSVEGARINESYGTSQLTY